MRLLLITLIALSYMPPKLWAGEGLVPLQFEEALSGDSFHASGKQIKLWGINAPGARHILNFTASLYLETLLKAWTVSCKEKERQLYQCFVNGKDIAEDIVLFGLAEDISGHYALQQAQAQREKRGLWNSPVSDEL